MDRDEPAARAGSVVVALSRRRHLSGASGLVQRARKNQVGCAQHRCGPVTRRAGSVRRVQARRRGGIGRPRPTRKPASEPLEARSARVQVASCTRVGTAGSLDNEGPQRGRALTTRERHTQRRSPGGLVRSSRSPSKRSSSTSVCRRQEHRPNAIFCRQHPLTRARSSGGRTSRCRARRDDNRSTAGRLARGRSRSNGPGRRRTPAQPSARNARV